MPFIKVSDFTTEIVGESFYQKEIKEIVMFKDLVDRNDIDYKDPSLKAQLILEDENKLDPGNAVRVDIEGKTVGYLVKEDARKYRKELIRLGIPNEICTCKATAYGHREDVGKTMKFGIWLSFDITRPLELGEEPKRKKFLGIF
jgi:hypothetical protein